MLQTPGFILFGTFSGEKNMYISKIHVYLS